MVDTVTTASGTSVSYPPGSMYGYGNGNCNNGGMNNAAVQGEHFLAHLITNDDRHNGEHHILNRLSQIQSDIPTAEGAIQSAISASQNSLSSQLNAGVLGLQGQASTYALNEQNLMAQYALAAQNQGAQNALAGANQLAQTQIQLANNFGAIENNIATARENINLQVRGVQDSVTSGTLFNAQQFGQLGTQAAVNTGVLNAAIIADGDRTRALINQNYIETLNRQLATAQNEIIELRGDRNSISRHHETEVRVNQNVNQQQQQQQQQVQLGAILGRLEGLVQVAHATNQNVIAGNTGAVQTGAQTANPTNVRI
jgi:hypothetical protein